MVHDLRATCEIKKNLRASCPADLADDGVRAVGQLEVLEAEAHEAVVVFALFVCVRGLFVLPQQLHRCQYLHFCTGKASKLVLLC